PQPSNITEIPTSSQRTSMSLPLDSAQVAMQVQRLGLAVLLTAHACLLVRQRLFPAVYGESCVFRVLAGVFNQRVDEVGVGLASAQFLCGLGESNNLADKAMIEF